MGHDWHGEVDMLTDVSSAHTSLDSITDRQKAVMDLVLQHRTSKEIARELNIAPNTVDQRINAVREKFGAKDRAETARIYAHLSRICGRTTYGSSVIETTPSHRLPETQDDEIEPVFMLRDSAAFAPENWHSIDHLVIPRAKLSDSKLWRLVAIVVIAVGVAVLATTILAVMQSLNALL